MYKINLLISQNLNDFIIMLPVMLSEYGIVVDKFICNATFLRIFVKRCQINFLFWHTTDLSSANVQIYTNISRSE